MNISLFYQRANFYFSLILLDKILWKCIWSLKEIEKYLKIKNDNTVWQEGKNTKTHQNV